MSRIGKKPIDVPTGVTVDIKGRNIKVSGPNGKLEIDCHPLIDIKAEGSQILVVNNRPEDSKARQLHGTMRALIGNMVTGVSQGFQKKMQIYVDNSGDFHNYKLSVKPMNKSFHNYRQKIQK